MDQGKYKQAMKQWIFLLLSLAIARPLPGVSCHALVELRNGRFLEAQAFRIVKGWIILEKNGGEIRLPQSQVATIEQSDCTEANSHEPAEVAELVKETGALYDETTVERPAALTEVARQVARKYGLPEKLVLSVMEVESGFRARAQSSKGAIGPMQLMPVTAQELGVNPQDPVENIRGGVQYLRWLLLKYLDHPRQLELALAAYNAGPGQVDRFGGVPPFPETHNYIRQVLKRFLKKLECSNRFPHGRGFG